MKVSILNSQSVYKIPNFFIIKRLCLSVRNTELFGPFDELFDYRYKNSKFNRDVKQHSFYAIEIKFHIVNRNTMIDQ